MCMVNEWTNVIIFAAGLVLIIKGADWVTEYGSRLAKRLGVSELVVGLTLVAMATSLPELAVSLVSVFSGVASIATGTVIGSNISNIALILGISALVCPLATGRRFLREGFATLGFSLLAAFFLLNGMVWYEGVMILALFAAYMAYAVKTARDGGKAGKAGKGLKGSGLKYVMFCIIGGLIVVGGAHLMVTSTVSIAKWLGVPELVIAIIIIRMRVPVHVSLLSWRLLISKTGFNFSRG